MRLFKIIFLLLLSHITCYGQNLRNNDSLPYGYWREAYNNTIEEGNYKIVSIRNYDTISCRQEYTDDWTRSYCNVKYKRSSTFLPFTIGKTRDSISVNDGIWTATDTLGKEERFYDNGILLRRRSYDLNNELISHYTHVFEHDSSVTLYYKGGRVFVKRYFPPGNGNDERVVYYPNDPLSISDCQLDFRTNFLEDPIDTNTITLSSHKTSTITGFSSKYIQLLDKQYRPVKFPIKITNRSSNFYLINKPFTPAESGSDEWSIINTAEAPYTYELDHTILGYHIDSDNVSTIKAITLSISKDRYLNVRGEGSLSNVYITRNDIRQQYSIYTGAIKIDLASFEEGIYKMEIFTEESANQDITLQITK